MGGLLPSPTAADCAVALQDAFGPGSDCHTGGACKLPGMTPVTTAFSSVVAHEIMGHNTLDQRMAKNFNEELLVRKYAVLGRGAGPDVVFGSGLQGIDLPATQVQVPHLLGELSYSLLPAAPFPFETAVGWTRKVCRRDKAVLQDDREAV